TAPPVLPAAHTSPEADQAGPGRYRRIAVALEMGPADEAVLAHVRTLAIPGETEIVLVHVAESAAGRDLGPQSSDQESGEDQVALDHLASQLHEVGIRAETRLGHGDAIAELARLVNEAAPDLLVTGAHGHRLIGDLVHGATASGVRHRVRC